MHEGGFFAYRMRRIAVTHRIYTERLVLSVVNRNSFGYSANLFYRDGIVRLFVKVKC